MSNVDQSIVWLWGDAAG